LISTKSDGGPTNNGEASTRSVTATVSCTLTALDFLTFFFRRTFFYFFYCSSIILYFFSSFNAIDRKIREVMHLTGNELLQEEEEKGQQQQQQYVKSL
jgi:hypothetical protein